jgi:UDP-N-acetylmuramyl pentapeptide phosphotransferase/UDP-N-acetylglucosamine-1-phosphate transferase
MLASFGIAGVVVLTTPQHGRFTLDPTGGVQKVHAQPTPRVGGVCIYLALLLARLLVHDDDANRILDTLLLAGVPALAIGLLEDVTKRVSVALRLAVTVGSGGLAAVIGGVTLTHLDLPFVDSAMLVPGAAFVLTAVAVGGMANAINVIDGFHGLASGATTLALLAIAAVAQQVGDTALVLAAIVMAAAVAGFWLVNFPWGKLFLGDGGAYFAGFALAWLAVLLPMRNPAVSPWASLLICGYPVIEVLYSVVRRWSRRQSAGSPDHAHLHSLVATRIVQPLLRRLHPTLQNAAVSVPMWICAAIPCLLGVTFSGDTNALAMGAFACLLLYHFLYRQVARL